MIGEPPLQNGVTLCHRLLDMVEKYQANVVRLVEDLESAKALLVESSDMRSNLRAQVTVLRAENKRLRNEARKRGKRR